MVRTLRSSKKAVSPVLATLFLIVLAVASILITYAWVMTYSGSQPDQAGIFLTCDAVSWSTSTTIDVYVRNTGTSDATIDTVYVGTKATNLTEQTFSYDPPTGLVLADGGVNKVTINYAWSSGTIYYFRIAPKVGVALEFNIESP